MTGCVQRFSDEVARVEGCRKTLVADGVVLEVVTAERMTVLCEELVLSFLRYNSAMLREVRTRVRQVVQRANLIESCAEQRREIIARQRALEQAEDGVCELIGVHTPARKEEWMLYQTHSLQQHHQILSWLSESSGGTQVKLQLLYRASRDGWQCQDFHSSCDNMGATVTGIKCTGGFVFGGHADAPWHSSEL